MPKVDLDKLEGTRDAAPAPRGQAAGGPTPRKTTAKKAATPKKAGTGPRRSTRSARKAAEPQAPAQAAAPATAVTEPRPAADPDDRTTKAILLKVRTSLWKKFALQRIDDGIDITVRVRALMELWETDDRIRARADKLAAERQLQLPKGRPPKDASQRGTL